MQDASPEMLSIFADAIERPSPEERAAFVDAVCGANGDLRRRIEALLRAHDAAGGFMGDRPAAAGPAETTDLPVGERSGTVGRYKLLEQIGDGGMGAVWMAEQTEPVRRTVALKLIKPGMNSKSVLARFEAERQALALMDHPNIAKVLDAGTTGSSTDPDGHPFFVMELVRGVPITRFCDEHHLTPRERLELFVPVCQAIQHAHQKSVIHRDIKPTNVLVALYDDRPVPKVIDFGVAKAMSQPLTEKTLHTGFGAVVGTVEYMSPEQASFNALDIDTRSDVYSLGALLYELLTGSPPFTRHQMETVGLLETLRVIREQEPPKPSTKLSAAEGLPTLATNRGTEPAKLTKLVRGELDWIVMKALEKDRNRRYDTVNDFALDVQRYLRDEPVQACPPSTSYRLRKFARRNKGPVLAVCLVVVALVGGIIGTTWGMLRATRAEATAVAEARLKEQERDNALAATRKGRHELFKAKLAEAKASRLTRQPGQRIDTWKALTEAAALAVELDLGDDDRLTLRNEAIACLGLTDVRHVRTWEGFPPGSLGHHPGFDAAFQRYARSDSKGNISVRNVDDDRQVALLPAPGPFDLGHGGSVIKYSPNGELLAVSYHQQIPGQASNFLLWDWRRKRVVYQPKFVVSGVPSFSRDGRFLALGQNDGAITLYEPATDKETQPIRADGQPSHLPFSPDGTRLAVGLGSEVQVRDVADGKLVCTLSHPGCEVMMAVWHPEGVLLAAGCNDGNIHLWDAVTGQRHTVLRGHTTAVVGLDFAPNGSTLVSGSWDGTSRLWDPWSGHDLVHFPSTALGFNREGTRLVSTDGVHNGVNVSLWEISEAREFRTLSRSKALGAEQFGTGNFSPEGRWMAVPTNNGVRLWNRAREQEQAFLSMPPCGDVRFHSDGTRLFTGGVHGLHEWPMQEREGVLRLGPPRRLPLDGLVSQLGSDREGRLLAAVGNSCAWVVDVADPSRTVCQVRHPNANYVATSPNGKWMATGTWGHHGVRIWEIPTGKFLVPLNPDARMGTVTFSPDGRWLVTGTGNEFVIWSTPQRDEPPDDPASWKVHRRIATENQAGRSAFTTDGKLLALTISPSVVQLLDQVNGDTIAKLTAPDARLWGVGGFSPDNSQFVMWTHVEPGAVRIWDLRKIREKLKEIGLDWDLPSYPPAPEPAAAKPVRVEVDYGELSAEFIAQRSRGSEFWRQNKPAEAIACFRQALSIAPESALANNDLAWALATSSDELLRNSKEAVERAAKAAQLAPWDRNSRNTLGVAHYRAGDYNAALAELERSMRMNNGGDSFDWFFLAMVRWQLNDRNAARKWYDRADEWMRTHQPKDEELQRFRAEAAELLKVEGIDPK